MSDPIPVLPQLRRTCQLSSKSPLRGTFGDTLNCLMVISTTESFPQVEITAMLVKEIEEETWVVELEFVARKQELWSKRSKEFMDRIDPLTKRKYKEFSKTHKSSDPMVIVAWNCRGLLIEVFMIFSITCIMNTNQTSSYLLKPRPIKPTLSTF